MESVDHYGTRLLNKLPPFIQLKLPIVSARLRSFGSLQSSIAGSASCNSTQQSSRRREITATFASNSNIVSDAGIGNSRYPEYPEPSSSSSSSSSESFYSSNRRSVNTSLSTILASNDDDPYYPGNTMTDQDSIGEIHYEQLMRHFLRSVRETDPNHQMDGRRLLEGSQMQLRSHELGVSRLPHHFNGQSHDAVNQRWSPSGIKWRYARQGAQLAVDASNEMDDAGFERSAYIDAVAYYLRALPDELDQGETAKLLSASPWLTQLPHPEPQIAITRPTDRGRPFLFNAVQYAVVGLVLLGHMLWCFLLSALRIGAYLEREYQPSQWLARNGYDLVNSFGRHSVIWTARLNTMNNGRFGQVVSWTMDSITGGIQEGYGKGMERVRQQNMQTQGDETIVDLRRSKSFGQ